MATIDLALLSSYTIGMDFALRPAEGTDEPFLWRMLYYAAHMDEDGDLTPESAKSNPDLEPYVGNWAQYSSDLGFLAVTETVGRCLGAAWLRLMPPTSPIYRFVDSSLPELAIALEPDCVGAGIGSALLKQLLATAKERYPAVALSVRASNPAKRLYERFGFTVVAQIKNRVGGTSFVMNIDLGSI